MPDSEFYPGCYRGVVEEAEDVDERFRYRVRVHHVHPDEIPVEHLPWAETIAFAGTGFGDVPHYENGDRVWVMFEGGNREYPCVIGGWIAAPGGIPDVPPEQSEKYNTTRRRWFRQDRSGNLIEMSEVDGELRVRMRSGGAEVSLSQIDDSINIKTTGRVNIEAETAEVTAKTAVVRGDEVTIQATKRNGSLGTGVLNLFTTKTVNLYAGAIPGLDPNSEVLIGKIVDGNSVTRQTQLVRIEPSVVEIGKKDAGLPTLNVTIEAATAVNLKSNTLVELEAPQVTLKAGTQVRVDSSDIEVGLGSGKSVMFDTIIAKFNSHTHPTAGTGPPSVPSVLFDASDASANMKAT